MWHGSSSPPASLFLLHFVWPEELELVTGRSPTSFVCEGLRVHIIFLPACLPCLPNGNAAVTNTGQRRRRPRRRLEDVDALPSLSKVHQDPATAATEVATERRNTLDRTTRHPSQPRSCHRTSEQAMVRPGARARSAHHTFFLTWHIILRQHENEYT